LSRRLLSFLAVCTALCALWAWGPGLFRTAISLGPLAPIDGDQAEEVVQAARNGLPANVYLLAEGEHVQKNGTLTWWQGPARAPRRVAVRNGGARLSVADWDALKEQTQTLTVELENSFPASIRSCSVASSGAGTTRLLLELGKPCALSIQAQDFDGAPIPHAKLELWGAEQSLGPAQDSGPLGCWEGTVYQADRLTLTVSAQGYVPIGKHFPRPAAARYADTVVLPRVIAGGLVLDRRQDTFRHATGYLGAGQDLAPWSTELLQAAEQRVQLDPEYERVLWLVESERPNQAEPIVHIAQFRVDAQQAPLVSAVRLKPLLTARVRPLREANEWPRELVAVDLLIGPRDAWLARALPDRMVLGIEREGEKVLAQTGYRVPGEAARFRFFVRPGWLRFVPLGKQANFQRADYPPILASEWFEAESPDAAVAQLDVMLEPGVFYSEYGFLDQAGREYPGAGRIFGVAAQPRQPGWSELLVRSPRPQTSYFREGGTAQLWLAGRSGVGYLASESLAVARPKAEQPWQVVVSDAMLARIGE
jgi:hypothetical protein